MSGLFIRDANEEFAPKVLTEGEEDAVLTVTD